jgi:hypothetical protein
LLYFSNNAKSSLRESHDYVIFELLIQYFKWTNEFGFWDYCAFLRKVWMHKPVSRRTGIHIRNKAYCDADNCYLEIFSPRETFYIKLNIYDINML